MGRIIVSKGLAEQMGVYSLINEGVIYKISTC